MADSHMIRFHKFQVLIGILTILYKQGLLDHGKIVSSPYRYSNNKKGGRIQV